MSGSLLLVALLFFEVVVTLGVAFWAVALARGVGRNGELWGIGTAAVSFGLHRLFGWWFPPTEIHTLWSHPLGTAAGVLPFGASILVFVLAPIVLPRVLPDRPRRLPPHDD